MARAVFIFYFFISLMLCLFFTYVKTYQMPFDYEQIFEVSEILYYSFYLLVGMVFFLVGYHFVRLKTTAVSSVSFDIAIDKLYKYRKLFLLIQLFIVFYFLSKLFVGVEYENGEQYIKNYRPLGDKISTLLLLFQSALVVFLSKHARDRVLVISCSVVISFMFAWIDASRAAILPLAGVVYIFYKKKKYIQFSIYFMLLVLFYMIAIVGRSYVDRIGYGALGEIINTTITGFDEVLVWVVSYFTAFSIFQFAYVTRDALGSYTLYDLLYSIVPVPSFFWGDVPDYDNWRADEFRPMGAVSEVYRVSQYAMYCYFFVVGCLAKLVDGIKANTLKLFALAVFLMTSVMMFQYNLRTIQWFYYLIFLVFLYDYFYFRRRV